MRDAPWLLDLGEDNTGKAERSALAQGKDRKTADAHRQPCLHHVCEHVAARHDE